MSKRKLYVGVDVGSTTTKVAVLDAVTHQVLYSEYRRHHAAQAKSVYEALERLSDLFSEAQIHLALTGSGSKPLAEAMGVPYVQEVVANSIALRTEYENVGTAIELGGQ